MGELRPDQLDQDLIARCACGAAIPCNCVDDPELLDALANLTDERREQLLAALDADTPEG